MTPVRLSGVTKRYAGSPVLEDVNLALDRGVTGLLGPNGAGKTTLLRILATVLAPDAGHVRLLGEDPGSNTGRLAVRRRMGYLPQETGFPRGFTAFGFVDYIAILKEWADRPARHAEVRRVLDLVDLGGQGARRVSALSGGQRRRVALAQALLGDPTLLVLDEPTTGLDPEQRARLRGLLSDVGQSGTVVLSTHQTDDVAALCERVVVLADGRVHYDGTVPGLVAAAAGRVWVADEHQPGARHAWRTGTGRIRHVGEPPPGAQTVDPTLEDAYLLLLGDRAAAHERTAV